MVWERRKLSAGSGRSPGRKRGLVHFELERITSGVPKTEIQFVWIRILKKKRIRTVQT